VQPEENRINKQLQPDGSQIENNTGKRKDDDASTQRDQFFIESYGLKNIFHQVSYTVIST